MSMFSAPQATVCDEHAVRPSPSRHNYFLHCRRVSTATPSSSTRTDCISDPVQEQGLQGKPSSPGRGRVPRSTAARVFPNLPETGREDRKVNSKSLFPQVSTAGQSTKENFNATSSDFKPPSESYQPSLTGSNIRLSL